MRLGTLVAVLIGAVMWSGDLLITRVRGHAGDPWYWFGMATLVGGVALGSYVRRNDRRVPRHLVDERGVTLGLRGLYALPWDEEDGYC